MDGETVQVFRPTTETDRYENAVRMYSDTASHSLAHALYAPAGSSEVNDARSAVLTQPSLYLPAGADLEAADRVKVRDLVYEVDGAPDVWPDGVVAKLKRVEG